jgi:conjugal transfer pilus assembly protein TraF
MRIIYSLLVITTLLHSSSFYETHREGWFFYDDPNEDNNITEEKLEKMSAKELEAKLESLKDIAVSNPTKENLANYILAQNVAVKRSEKFASVWQEVLLEKSELDIAAPLAKSGFEKNVKIMQRGSDTKNFWEQNIDKIGFVVFVDPKDEVANESMQRVYFLLSEELRGLTSKKPVIRFVDISKNEHFKDSLGIVTTPDNFIVYSDDNGEPIYKRIKAGVATKAELLKNVRFVYD